MTTVVKFFKKRYIPLYGTIYEAKTVNDYGMQINSGYVYENYLSILLKYLLERGYNARIVNENVKNSSHGPKVSVPVLNVTIRTKEDAITFDIMNLGVIEIPSPVPQVLPRLKI